jgi:hypothetical protein
MGCLCATLAFYTLSGLTPTTQHTHTDAAVTIFFAGWRAPAARCTHTLSHIYAAAVAAVVAAAACSSVQHAWRTNAHGTVSVSARRV